MYSVNLENGPQTPSPRTIVLGNGDHVKTYCVYNDHDPIVEIELNAHMFFADAIIFGEYVIIGNYYEGIYVISLSDLSVRNIKIKGYFGYFEIDSDVLYVLGCENVVAFDHDLEQLWESDDLAVDGVICEGIEDDTMLINCEMDPPDGWIQRKISLNDGKIIE